MASAPTPPPAGMTTLQACEAHLAELFEATTILPDEIEDDKEEEASRYRNEDLFDQEVEREQEEVERELQQSDRETSAGLSDPSPPKKRKVETGSTSGIDINPLFQAATANLKERSAAVIVKRTEKEYNQ